jgi:predicted lactoylglutathione lyase
MIVYTTIGTNNLTKAAAFYDALFIPMGYARVVESESKIAWGIDTAHPMFFVCKPFDGKPATNGNGSMIALAMKSAANVEATHSRAIELGAVNEGAAGPRGPSFYCAYFRDLDGNKLNLFCLI